MDVCSICEPTAHGSIMSLFIIDETTRYKWVYLLQQKSETTYYIVKLLNQLQPQFRHFQVQRLHSNQGGEFESNELRVFCGDRGIILQAMNSYSPQENGIDERANGVMPNLLWGEALLHVVETLNELQTKPSASCLPMRSCME
ncbi:Rve domain containing hypothetical protein [Phytophthora palmivora]|uniref:Integrase catalytic domain-containing protein n=1 Tax=Phytophthora palmivora TaxID=4796 RepID=A0A2P4X4N5_9STRA|nr:Rve domain containing hypothetical protein [Phytophthora palmivora]